MVQPVVVIGAGGFGREVLDVLEAINGNATIPLMDVLGVVDDHPSSIAISRLADRGVKHLGGLKDWLIQDSGERYIVAIGDPVVRSRICETIESLSNLEPISIVHPSAVVGSQVRLGKGSVVCAGVQISTNVDVGDHVHLNPGAVIGHDASLANYVSINPGAVVSGEVTIGAFCLVGAGSVVLQGLTLGARSIVGAGGVVTRDVAENAVVKGVPAR